MEKIFHGKIKSIKLTSNNMGYGPCPDLGDEVEQRLTIINDGRFYLTRYSYGGEIANMD